MELNNIETHKFLPTGIWEGFYCYHNSSVQHKMQMTLRFKNNKIYGSGIDDVGSFKWSGKYNLNEFKVNLSKNYSTHLILYNGDIDENGIWGIWNNGENLSKFGFSPEMINLLKKAYKDKIQGGFHIWPKKRKEKSEQFSEEEINKSTKLEEIFIEHFRIK